MPPPLFSYILPYLIGYVKLFCLITYHFGSRYYFIAEIIFCFSAYALELCDGHFIRPETMSKIGWKPDRENVLETDIRAGNSETLHNRIDTLHLSG